MKLALPIFCAAVALVVGCSDQSGKPGQPTNSVSSSSPLTAPVDYLGAVGNAKQQAVKTVDISSLTQAVQMFQVSEGRLPKDLNELVTMKYIAKIPAAPYGKKIVYNPATGQVSVVPQ
ncbi:MAG: hypothetical protein MUE94_00985 [Verrucomicrobia bacterium]|nr:hypothetical protein [Verrucomicrobiota bacterium]